MVAATLLALGSAALHATWNLGVKTSTDRDITLLGQFTAAGLLALPVLAITGLPGRAAVPWLLLSALVHVGYVAGLSRAYHHGDFSLAYPMARGAGAVLAAVGGVLFLDDRLRVGGWIALAVVGSALISLSWPGGTRASVGWALATAATIATYTLLDSKGSRVSASGASYAMAFMPLTAVSVVGSGVAFGKGPALLRSLRTTPWRHLGAGACLVGAYTMVLIAVRLAPVGYVSMLRESSVVLGAGAGWLLLDERLGARRLASSGVMVCGLALLIATR